MWDSGSKCRDPSFEDEVDLQEKDNNNQNDVYKMKIQELLLPETEITKLSKTGVEPEWFNTK